MSAISSAKVVTPRTGAQLQTKGQKKALRSLQTPNVQNTATWKPNALRSLTSTSSRTHCQTERKPTKIFASTTEAAKDVQPTVRIDNLSDPMCTIIHVSYGTVLGDLVDTMAGLRNLGLNVSKASMASDEESETTFFVTSAESSLKVTGSTQLEEIKSSILSTMVEFHPEAEALLASKRTGRAKPRGPLEPREAPPIPTSIKVASEMCGSRSRLDIVTTDRAGLLVDVVKLLKDISVSVVSAEVDTIGIMAHDIFFLQYKGEALNSSMEDLVKNSLSYHLADLREESY